MAEERMFGDLTPEERLTMLQDNAYKIELQEIRRPYTPEQIVGFKDQLAEESIILGGLEDKLDEIKQQYKTEMQPHKDKHKEAYIAIRDKSFKSEENIYMFPDYDNNNMDMYDANGYYLSTRKLFPGERQVNIKPLNKAV